ncbi:unnamed protein product [Cochlearia groenlandica]
MAINGDDKVTAATTTVMNGGDENPKNFVDLNTSEPDRTDGEVEGLLESAGEKKGDDDSKAIGSVDSGDDDVQKKIRRAERFGVSVKLTEKEKRDSRAERFGTVGAVKESGGTKKAEELKRKARADRFGVPASASTTDKTEEETKKKARLARFGKDAKADTKVDSAEEDKRKARALRFSKAASDSSAELTVKQNIGKEAAVSGTTA